MSMSSTATTPSHPTTQALATAYDNVPYQSKPFAQTSPEQLAVMARLFGLDAPAVAHARVLELGCAAGGNLIPLAVRYPGMQVHGIDLSRVQVEQGQQLVARLGLANCTLQVMDIAQAVSNLQGPFDYIICHGVFSWVPEPVRQAILDLCRQKLSPSGVAYISYNVYPGWKTREVIREMMMFHAGRRATPAERVQQARAILDYTKNISSEQSAYGQLLRQEAAQVARAEDHYLFHEYLEIENNPMYFREFVQLAAQHQLAYLGEAGLADMAPQRLGKDIHDTLARLSSGNILATEQYMDFFTNRTFRQTLLVHESQAARINRNLSPATLRSFAISTALTPDESFKPTEGQAPIAQYKDNLGRTLGVNTPLAHALVQCLVSAKPESLSFDTLLDRLGSKLPQLSEHRREVVAHSVGMELLNLLVQNVVRLSLEAQHLPPEREKPIAQPLARAQAQTGQDWATNHLHQPINLSPAHRSVLALLDGQHDIASVQRDIHTQLQDGRLTARRDGVAITDETQLQDLAQQFTQQALHELRQWWLLQ
jgi:methyltransferase-like protein/cyclopropane fatty-acyl-phospholipid synthase-like methyltransferase